LTAEALSEVLDGFVKTASGAKVTRNRVLGLSPVWRAIQLVSGDVAKLPLQVNRVEGATASPDSSHPAYRLLRRKPNRGQTPFVFKTQIVVHMLLKGNAYVYVDRSGSRPVELVVLDPDSVEPVYYKDEPWYLYQPADGPRRKIHSADMLHFRGMSWNGLLGLGILGVCREELGSALATRDYSSRYFANNARPGGLIEVPGKLTDPANRNLRESWERLHKGLDNAHKIAILQEGAKYNPITPSAKDSQLLDARNFDARTVANLIGVPAHKLGDPSKVAYNSLDSENQSYYDDTLSRLLQCLSEEFEDKLLTEDEKDRDSHNIRFLYREIQRADLAKQTAFVTSMCGKGLLTKNEGRAVFDYPPLPDGDSTSDPELPMAVEVPNETE
jgi:HK97 family phage portal protein